MTMSLDRRQMDDLFSNIHFWNFYTLGENMVKLEQRTFEAIYNPCNFWQGNKRKLIALEHGHP